MGQTKAQMEEIPRLKLKYLAYYRDLPIQKLAAASVGRDDETIMRWRKDDLLFRDQVEAARAEWAKKKVKKVKSGEWLLERIIKEHFVQKFENEFGVSAELERVMQYVRDILKKE